MTIPRDSYTRAVRDDCREFLARQQPVLERGEHCFGYEHQTRLRAICAITGLHSRAEIDSIVDQYWGDPDRRSELATATLTSHTPSERGAESERFVFSETRVDHFDDWLSTKPDAGVVSDYGIASLEGAHSIDGPRGATYAALPASRPTSIGMLMFYGFSPYPGHAVVQDLPIRILAATAQWCARHGVPPATRIDWTTDRLTDACRSVDQLGEFETAARDVFLLHEAGHLPETLHPQDPLHQFADVCGIAAADMVSGAFPDHQRRQTWPRLKERPSLAGALYMLGDLIANLRALAFASIAPASWAFMQAFNWRFVPPDGPLRVPRGNLALLLDAGPEHASGRGAEIIERVAGLHHRPDLSLSGALTDLESELWRELRRQEM